MTGTLGSRKSQSLFYWKLLCNKIETIYLKKLCWVTILVLLETPLQYFFSYKSHGQAYKSQSLFYWKLLCNANRKIISAKELESQSLFYWKLLCNANRKIISAKELESQSLFYWKLLCNTVTNINRLQDQIVTILVLLETPLQ